jgi:hypothetical protein
LLDQAGWHGSAELVVPPNITLMPLPPRCPELNPVENVWQFMRDNWLSIRLMFEAFVEALTKVVAEAGYSATAARAAPNAAWR